MPNAPVGIVGIERDEQTARPALYYDKLPNVLPEKAVILDPMLATGGTACLVAEMLICHGYAKHDIHFSGVLAAPEGMNRLSEIIPRSHIVVAAIDQGLDAQNFIVPGLGDYGDRYYGT
jgi:uracil phosphoribosyltransferase